MNEGAREPSVAEVKVQLDEIIFGLKWLFSLVFAAITIPNFCTASAIVPFQQIYQDALPGKPLPLLTLGVISCALLLKLLAVIWPILGILNIVYAKRPKTWIIGSAIIFLIIGIQWILTWLALFLPMVGLITDIGVFK